MSSRRQFGSARRLPSGRWQATYRLSGREYVGPSTFPTKTDALHWLAQAESDIARGEWRDPRLGRVTFAEWVAHYLNTVGSRKRATTRARDEAVIRRWFLPSLGPRSLSSIAPLDVHGLVDAMTAELAPATVRTNYGVLRAVLNAAVAVDLIVRSPCRGVRLPPAARRTRPLLTPEDLDRLAAALPTAYCPTVYLGGVLGLRWSEVVGLRVRHLDFLSRTITVAETIAEVEGRLMAAEPKSRSSARTIAVPPFLMDILSVHLARRGRPGPDELVFVSAKGGPLRASHFRSRVWPAALKAAQLEGLTFHGLRHVATSLMVEAGEHPRVIQHRLGHSNFALSMEVYAHVGEPADRAAAAHLEARFNRAPAADRAESAGPQS